jgi:hypothetical protein
MIPDYDCSWEDDIDYCYDHAAEADCEYEWSRRSVDASKARMSRDQPRLYPGIECTSGAAPGDSSAHRYPEHGVEFLDDDEEDTLGAQANFSRRDTGAFGPSLQVPDVPVPDLTPRSATTAATESTLLTPSDSHHRSPIAQSPSSLYASEHGDGFGYSFHPPLLLSQDPKYPALREDLYDDLLADYESSDQHYPLLEPTASVVRSSRSSSTRLSKRSSYDSSLRSGAESVYSSIRRSASSSSSLPELVHSRRSRRTIEQGVQRISEQMDAAYLAMPPREGEDGLQPSDSDKTPTNTSDNDNDPSPSSDRTFYAGETDDERPVKHSIPRKPILARTASTEPIKDTMDGSHQAVQEGRLPTDSGCLKPSSHHPHHERASSDGAAKLLSFGGDIPLPSAKSNRQRSASHSHSRKASNRSSTYTLSLFPPAAKQPKSPRMPSIPS